MTYYGQIPQPSWGRCESFFLESDDDSYRHQRAQLRERARLEARERQGALASELSRITSDEYQEDVLAQMEEMEARTIPDVHSIDIQTEIQWFMRPYLLDFLVEAHSAFGLLPDTLYLAVNLLDRYCSRRVVYKRHYQLVGCAALLIASKYGDRKERVPQIKELKAMCCALYEEEMFTQMEWHLLQTLDWTIGHPTIDAFLQVAMAESLYDPEVEHVAWYISELALFHKEFVSAVPSDMARSALALARFILARAPSQSSEWADAYDPQLVSALFNQLQHPSSVVAKKYASYHLSSASMKVRIFVDRHNELERAKQPAPPTPPVEVGTWTSTKFAQQPPIHPQTPQKMPYPPITNHGLYTPPITPDNESGVIAVCGGQPSHLSVMMPDTPTPSSVGSHHQSREELMTFPPVHHDAQYYVS